jgi:hypothetical protein
MLDKELRGVEYKKTEHRRRLSKLLNTRSDGAIERKHQNISAILTQLHFPYISGYKPLMNYQRLLYDVVSARLENNNVIQNIVRVQVDQHASLPTIDDILSVLVDPPLLDHHDVETMVREPKSLQYKVDYLAQEARNSSLGTAGEQFVVLFEKARLIHAGHERLASQVEHISKTQGDSAGFDVLSFDLNGRERFIEVKTTAYGALTPFFVTQNEVDVSHKVATSYYLYRAFDFRRQPKIFSKQGPINESFNLAPTQYVANLT